VAVYIDWYFIRFIVGYAALGASLACFGMGVFRYFRDQISDQRRTTVRRSLIAFAVHPFPICLALASASALYSVGGEEFAMAMLLLSLVLSGIALFTTIYLGFRSGVCAGRRVALAGICMVVGMVAGDLTLLFGLFSKVVA
jgi:hypothetical protein